MATLLFIFTNIVLPVFIQIAIGYTIHKKFNLNIRTLSKATLFIFMPALLFVKIYSAPLSASVTGLLVLYAVLMFLILLCIAHVVGKMLRLDKNMLGLFKNSISIYNAGNYCIPLLMLLFDDPYAISLIVFIIFGQNILNYTIGIYNVNNCVENKNEALISIFKIPMLYTILLAMLFNKLNVQIPSPIWSSINIISQGMVPISLITLGTQLANISFNFSCKVIYISNFFRLIISPIIAFCLIYLFKVEGLMAQVMLISSGAPTAVNTALLAIEFDNKPDFASQVVFSSTVFSMITMTIIIYFVTNLPYFS